MENYELVSGQKGKPVFASQEECSEALEKFYQDCLPDFKRMDEARRKSIELSMTSTKS